MTASPLSAGRRSPVLVEALGASRGRAADLALVLGGTLALTLISQVAVPLPFTPVPLTLGTLGALLIGSALGPTRGVAAVGLYGILAALGVPVLAGWSATGVTTASFGYVIGYVLAAAALGAAARRGADRSFIRTGLAAIGASALIYLPGLAWLMLATGMDLTAGLVAGVAPFVVGDVIKALAAAALLPGAWALLRTGPRGAARG